MLSETAFGISLLVYIFALTIYHSVFFSSLFHKFFPLHFLVLFGLFSWILDLNRPSHWRLFVLVSSLYIFVLATCARLS